MLLCKNIGHKDLRTIQHYAKVLDRKVSEDMMILRDKFKEGLISESLKAKNYFFLDSRELLFFILLKSFFYFNALFNCFDCFGHPKFNY